MFIIPEIKASLKPTEEQENSEEEFPGGKRPYIARNQRLARERFNNFNDRNPSGFSGFGGQPSVGMEDDFDPPSVRDRDRDSDRSRSKFYFDSFNFLFLVAKLLYNSLCLSVLQSVRNAMWNHDFLGQY